MRAWLGAALLLILLGYPARAGGPGTTSGDFLRLAVGARPVSLGETYVGLADDADALYYNPGAIGLFGRQQFSFMHDEFTSQVHHEWFAYALPTREHGVFAASADIVFVEPFAAYNDNDQPLGKVNAMDSAYALAYGYSPFPGFSLGGQLKYIHSRLDNISAKTQAVDAGALFRPFKRLSFGASALNMGQGLRYINETFPLPTSLKAGAAWRIYEDIRFKQSLTLLADGTIPRNESPYVSGGAEFIVYDSLAFRAGARMNQDVGVGFAAGIGVLINRDSDEKTEIDIDYAIVDMGILTRAHRASLKIKFGKTRNEAAHRTPRWIGDRVDHGAGKAPARRRKWWKVRDEWTEEDGKPAPAAEKPAPEQKAKPKPKAPTPHDETNLLRPLIWVNP